MNWKFIWTGSLSTLTGVDFADSNIGYVCGNRNKYYYEQGVLAKAVDGGDTWNFITIPFPANFSGSGFYKRRHELGGRR